MNETVVNQEDLDELIEELFFIGAGTFQLGSAEGRLSFDAQDRPVFSLLYVDAPPPFPPAWIEARVCFQVLLTSKKVSRRAMLG